MIGLGTTMTFIGKSGLYASILSPHETMFGLPTYGGSSPSISDASGVGGVSLVEVVPLSCPVDSIYISIVFRRRPNRRVSDRVMEVEVASGDESRIGGKVVDLVVGISSIMGDGETKCSTSSTGGGGGGAAFGFLTADYEQLFSSLV